MLSIIFSQSCQEFLLSGMHSGSTLTLKEIRSI